MKRFGRAALALGLFAAFLAVEVPSAHGGTFPGGNGLIVFVADQFATGDYEIYTMKPDGSGMTQLTDTSGVNTTPTWSADGKKIAFLSTRDGGNPEIYVMNADGSDQMRLTTTAGSENTISWSADGKKIAFMSDEVTVDNPTGDTEIFVMNADGSDVTQLTSNSIPDASSSYSPDGTKIAFDRDVNGPSEIWTMNADGSGQTQITSNPGTQDVSPKWSPDGTKILWRRDFGGCGQADIWVMNADGSSPSPVICDSVGHESAGTYSPDGEKLVFISTRDFNGGFGQEEIYVANADGSSQTRITTTTYNEFGPDWQPTFADYETPRVAKLMTNSLVPAFRQTISASQCTARGGTPKTHGPPFSVTSCDPPVAVPGRAARAGDQFQGEATVAVLEGDPTTLADEADDAFSGTLTDVRDLVGDDYNPNPSGADLTLRLRMRITDRASGLAQTEPATTIDLNFSVPVGCTPTANVTIGSSCNVSATADGVLPGAIQEGKEQVLQVSRLRVDDAGLDGVRGNSDDRLFLQQGVYNP
jgi:Tol biopolymer transport system component